MSVSRDEVLRIAQLAELDVDEDALPEMADQMSRILDYVAQLSAIPGPSYADGQVDYATRYVYDWNYRGAGNWPDNATYAATFAGISGCVTCLSSLHEAELFIRECPEQKQRGRQHDRENRVSNADVGELHRRPPSRRPDGD